ncbi:MAG: Crp/Fnr family transcriptional regulator [Pseudomonadota bacterium]
MAEPSKLAERTYWSRSIAAASLFQGLAADDVAELARCARGLAVPRGKPISAPKGKDGEIYVVETGAAALLDLDPATEKSVLVTLLGPGGVIGLVRAAEWMAGGAAAPIGEWRALSNLTLVAIPISDFVRVLRRSSELSAACLGSLATTVREVTGRFSASLQHPLEMRLAAFLEQFGAIAAGNLWEPTVNLGRLQQTQIGEMLGVSREHINRTLTMWEKSGLIFQSKSGDLIIENRKRLAQLAGSRQSAGSGTADNDYLWEIEAHINLGLNIAAHDLAMEGARRAPKDDRFKYFAVLALARMGSLSEALSLAETFKLSTDAANEDVASIGPRLRRDLAFEAGDAPDGAQLKAAAEGFERIFDAMKTAYAGVNAASTFAMSGDLSHARAIASIIRADVAGALEEIDDDEPSYWSRATLAECLLIEGDKAAAASEFGAAAKAIDAAPGKIATTRKQLRRLKTALGVSDAWIDRSLPQGKVLYFCGPLTPASGARQKALEALKTRAADFFSRNQCIAAIGALAAGADIIIAEAALEAGTPLHVHLPLPPTEFLAASVAPSGGDWRERFIACLERAKTIEWVRRTTPSRSAYRLGARIAMGRAMRMASELATDPFSFMALQNGRTIKDSVSVENSEIWKSLGLGCVLEEDDWLATSAEEAPKTAPTYLYAVAAEGGDVRALESSITKQPLFKLRNGTLPIYLYDAPQEAVEAARQVAQSTAGASARIWLDVGIGVRDEKNQTDLAQSLLTVSCRPQTAPGKIYASEDFAYAAIATLGAPSVFDYVGFVPTDEKLAPCPLFLIDY